MGSEHESGDRQTAGEVERIILRTLQELLGRSDFGVHDNFFDLGADSQMIVTARERLSVTLGRDLPVVDLFTYPNVAALAAYLTGAADGSAAGEAERRAQQRLSRLTGRRDRMGIRARGASEV